MIPPILHTEKWTGSEHKVRPSVLLLLWPHFINSLRFTSLYVSRTIRVCLLLYYKFLSLSLPLDFHHCHNTVLRIGFGSQSLGPNLKNSFIVRLIFSSSLSISSSSSSLQFLNTSVIIFRPIRKVRSPFFWDSTRSNSPRILSSASSSHYPSNCPLFKFSLPLNPRFTFSLSLNSSVAQIQLVEIPQEPYLRNGQIYLFTVKSNHPRSKFFIAMFEGGRTWMVSQAFTHPLVSDNVFVHALNFRAFLPSH